ncbi:MAG: hypothetical protein QXP77_01450 [Candidatus Aenigmatarchaeota archaeon]
MEVLIKFERKYLEKVKDALLKDDTVSRASVIFKEGKALGEEDCYCLISGLEEQCKKALELVKDMTKEVKIEEKDKIIKKIKEEEEKANESFGFIFG